MKCSGHAALVKLELQHAVGNANGHHHTGGCHEVAVDMVVVTHQDACRHGQEERVHLHSVRDIDGRWNSAASTWMYRALPRLSEA
jgi:hypothetical protein